MLQEIQVPNHFPEKGSNAAHDSFLGLPCPSLGTKFIHKNPRLMGAPALWVLLLGALALWMLPLGAPALWVPQQSHPTCKVLIARGKTGRTWWEQGKLNMKLGLQWLNVAFKSENQCLFQKLSQSARL